ncbi:MAG: hypothetical protein A2X48_22020 [Lentisphaerae bacterium GWF2_49_21]|nr:MAG: hypothetical protein A2X48_22020 [Lentisphaerae bacterium GWF2_49_21]
MSIKPNFVILYPDSLAKKAISCYGCPSAFTPNIDRLALGGAMFENCTSQNPACMPSRASLLTGKYVSAHGVYDNGVADYPQGHVTFQQILKRNGYHTAYYGKTHSINNQEWDDVFDLYPDYNRYLSSRRIDVKYPEKFPLEDLNAGFSRIPAEDFSEVILGNLAVSYIRRKKGGKDPFLLFMSFEAPHSPWSLPEEYRRFYRPEMVSLPKIPPEDRRNKPQYRLKYHGKRSMMVKTDDKLRHAIAIYNALVSVVDEQIGRIVSALDETRLRKNTVIILLSDHGDHLGNHRTMGKCLSLEENLINVPFIVNSPGLFKPHRSKELVESIDVFPTLMDLAGIPSPSGIQGTSILPFARNSRNASGKEFCFSEEYYDPFPGHLSVRNREFKLIVNSEGFEELYNIIEDPYEWFNLASNAEYRSTLCQLKDALVQFSFKHVDKSQKSESNWVTEFMKPGFNRY